jgi:hypothetical protein
VDVVKAGYFSVSSSGNTINYLRIDMRLSIFSPQALSGTLTGLANIAVTSPHAQYQFDSADSTLNVESITYNPDYTATGYWIFQVQGTLDPLNTVWLAFTGGRVSTDTWSFQL